MRPKACAQNADASILASALFQFPCWLNNELASCVTGLRRKQGGSLDPNRSITENLNKIEKLIFSPKFDSFNSLRRGMQAISPWYCCGVMKARSWPFNSPDLNHKDNQQGIVKKKTRDTRLNNTDELKPAIRATWVFIEVWKRDINQSAPVRSSLAPEKNKCMWWFFVRTDYKNVYSFFPHNSCVETTGVRFLHCLSLHWIILSCDSHKLESKELVILITFCEYAHRANRQKWPAIFRGWQSVEAVWLSWAHQNKQSTLCSPPSSSSSSLLPFSSLCVLTRFLFLFSSSTHSCISGMLATIVSSVQFVITAKAPSSKHSPHCSMETKLKFVYAHEAVCVTGDCIYLWAMCRLKLPGAKCHFNPVAAPVSLSGAQGLNWPQVLTQTQSHTHQHLGWHIQYFHEVHIQLRVYQKHAMPNLPVVDNQRCSKCFWRMIDGLIPQNHWCQGASWTQQK